MNFSSNLLEQFDHGFTHGYPDVHIGLSVAVVVAVGGAALTERMSVDSGYVPFEFGVVAGRPVHGELGIEDQFVIAWLSVFGGLPERCHDKLGLGCLEFFAQGLDQTDEVFLVPYGMRFDITVFVALPPGEALDFIAPSLPVGKFLVEVLQYFVSGPEAVVVLFAGIPTDGFGFSSFVPREGGLLVPCLLYTSPSPRD